MSFEGIKSIISLIWAVVGGWPRTGIRSAKFNYSVNSLALVVFALSLKDFISEALINWWRVGRLSFNSSGETTILNNLDICISMLNRCWTDVKSETAQARNRPGDWNRHKCPEGKSISVSSVKFDSETIGKRTGCFVTTGGSNLEIFESITGEFNRGGVSTSEINSDSEWSSDDRFSITNVNLFVNGAGARSAGSVDSDKNRESDPEIKISLK